MLNAYSCSYIDKMSKPGTYGDLLTAQCACEVYKIKIHCLTPGAKLGEGENDVKYVHLEPHEKPPSQRNVHLAHFHPMQWHSICLAGESESLFG